MQKTKKRQDAQAVVDEGLAITWRSNLLETNDPREE